MKTKILLFPLLLLIILATIIWFIVPAWQRISLQKTELQAKEKTLTEIMGRNQKIDGLLTEFNNNIDAQNIVFKFIPKEMGDDTIINSLIYYANLQPGDNMVKVNEISVVSPKDTIGNNAPVAPVIPIDANGNPLAVGAIDPATGLVVATPAIKATNFNVRMRFLSKYDGMKSFISDLSKLKRAYDFGNFKISHPTTTDGGDPNSLLFEAELAFNFLKEYNPIVADQSLLGEGFNSEIISMIKKRNSEVINVVTDSQGKVNPFSK